MILPWEYPECVACGTPFARLPTQKHLTMCKDCRPRRRNPPVRRRP